MISERELDEWIENHRGDLQVWLDEQRKAEAESQRHPAEVLVPALIGLLLAVMLALWWFS